MPDKSRKPLIRFKGFTDDWEQRKLGDMGNTYTGLSGKSKVDFGHGEGKFITYMNVFSNPVTSPFAVEYLSGGISQIVQKILLIELTIGFSFLIFRI